MKTNLLKTFFVALFLITATGINAHDFEADGIFYNITDATAKTVEVTYKGNSYGEYNEYSGSIIIPSSVTYNNTVYSITGIGERAFYGCRSLTSVEIPSSVTSIGDYAFNGCYGLASITVNSGNSVYDSREGCNAIIETATNTLIAGCKNTIIPGSVTSIGDYAFWECSGLTSIEIPSSVTSIGDHAFRDCSGLTSVVIPNSVTSIGDYAFYHCSDLTSVVIPNSVTSIGKHAFAHCIGLTSIEIPTGVTAIDFGAFSYCPGLASVVISNSVTAIGMGAFSGCDVLASIVVDEGNRVYDSRGGCNAIIETASNTLIAGCKNTVIPNSVTSIGDYAFEDCSGLTSIVIPSSVTSIGDYAFQSCDRLTSIVIPNSVTAIGMGAFSGCSGLASIVVDDGNSVYDSREGCNAIIETASNTLVAGCKNTVIPNSVTSIGDYAFDGCSGLTSVVISNSITSIGKHAFAHCIGLTSIVIPNSVTSIGDYAFYDCSRLTSVISYATATPAIGASVFGGISSSAVLYYPAGSDYSSWAQYFASTKEPPIPKYRVISESEKTAEIIASTEKYVGDVVIPSIIDGYTITGIGERAFYNCSSLASIELPNSVTSIGSSAFSGCSGLTSIELPNSVTSIGSSAFSGCSGLASIEIPNSVTSIGRGAFSDCSGLASIVVDDGNSVYDSRGGCNAIIETASNTLIAGCKNTVIPNSVTSIGDKAFSGCTGLTSIVIPNSVTSIGDYAFYGCRGLTSIVIPNSVTSIEDYAFDGCRGLTSIVIPNSVTSIGSFAFYYCSGLTSIELPNSVTSIGSSAFYYCSGLTSIELPNSVTSIGSSAFSGCSGLTSIVIPNSVTTIGDGAFLRCTGLTSVTIGNSVTSIGDDAFNSCSGLTSIVIPNSVTSIGDHAFYYCSGLASIVVDDGNSVYDSREGCNAIIETASNTLIAGCKNTVIPNSITSIGNYAFSYCSGLTSIEIPNSVTSIGGWAFYFCTGLTNVTIPNSVTTIGSHAFNHCSSLTNVTITDNVKSIGIYAFQYCDLRSIHIPASVESIGDYAFTWNLNLSSITVDKDNPLYYVPDGYENIIMERATNKIVFACGGAAIPQTATAIGAGAFNGVGGIESVTIHANITGIGDWAFDGCRDLKTIYALSETPLEISSNVFHNASSAVTLYVPYGAKEAYEAAEGWRNFTNIVEMEIQEVTITISEYGTATYCSEYALDFSEVEGLKAYAATGYNTATQVVTLTRVQTAVEETGLFLMGEPGEYVVPIIDFSNDYTLNLLIGTLEETTVNNKTDDGNYVNFKYTIANGDSRPMFYQFEDNSILSAGKAYLQLPARLFPSTASRSIGIRFDEGTATDIDEVECDDVYDAEAVYDMQGRKVKNPVNGIYIIGGKKVMIK